MLVMLTTYEFCSICLKSTRYLLFPPSNVLYPEFIELIHEHLVEIWGLEYIHHRNRNFNSVVVVVVVVCFVVVVFSCLRRHHNSCYCISINISIYWVRIPRKKRIFCIKQSRLLYSNTWTTWKRNMSICLKVTIPPPPPSSVYSNHGFWLFQLSLIVNLCDRSSEIDAYKPVTIEFWIWIKWNRANMLASCGDMLLERGSGLL